LDYPKLTCESCREAYTEGELADADGRMVYDGGCDPAIFRCAQCPDVLYGEVDESSALAQTIWNLVCQPLMPDQPVNLEFIFKLMGIQVGTPESREIYGRMLELRRILREHEELTKGQDDAPANGQDDDEEE
jgi:hypothetical protein